MRKWATAAAAARSPGLTAAAVAAGAGGGGSARRQRQPAAQRLLTGSTTQLAGRRQTQLLPLSAASQSVGGLCWSAGSEAGWCNVARRSGDAVGRYGTCNSRAHAPHDGRRAAPAARGERPRRLAASVPPFPPTGPAGLANYVCSLPASQSIPRSRRCKPPCTGLQQRGKLCSGGGWQAECMAAPDLWLGGCQDICHRVGIFLQGSRGIINARGEVQARAAARSAAGAGRTARRLRSRAAVGRAQCAAALGARVADLRHLWRCCAAALGCN